jgi:hypothetical protein
LKKSGAGEAEFGDVCGWIWTGMERRGKRNGRKMKRWWSGVQ